MMTKLQEMIIQNDTIQWWLDYDKQFYEIKLLEMISW